MRGRIAGVAWIVLGLVAGCEGTPEGAQDAAQPEDASVVDASAFDAHVGSDGGVEDASMVRDAAPADDAAVADPSPIRGLWLWDSAARLLEDEGARAAFFAFVEAPHGRAEAAIDRVFFEARDYDKSADPYVIETDYLAPAHRAALQAFVREASARGIAVDYLDGQARWARTAEREEPIAIAQAVIDYDLAVAPEERIAGIHFDIEPHQLGAEWRTGGTSCCTGARPDCYSDELEENIVYIAEEISRRIDASGLEIVLTFDIGTDYALCAPDLVEPLAGAGPDFLTIMNYFDDVDRFVNGEGGFGGVEQNLARVDALPLLFGVETICPPYAPDAMTFCDDGEPALEALIEEMMDRYGDDPRFAGIAIHHHDSYSSL